MESRSGRALRRLVTGLVVPVVLVALGLSTGLLYIGPDAPEEDHRAKFNELALRAAGLSAQDENMWMRLKEPFSRVPEVNGEQAASLAAAARGHADAEAQREARKLLAAYRASGAAELLSGLGVAPRGARLVEADGEAMFETTLDLEPVRHIVRLEGALASLALREGHGKDGAAALRRGLGAAQLTGQVTAIERVMANAAAILLRDHVRHGVMANRPDEATLRIMLDDLRAFSLPPIEMVMEGERLMGQEMLWRTLSESLYTPRSRGAQSAALEEIFEIARAYITAPRSERDPELLVRMDEYGTSGTRYSLASILTPSVKRLMMNEDAAVADHNGTLIMLAIEGFASRHGAPPETLDELVPEWLDEIPADPFCVQGFRYRLVNAEDDEFGRSYVLYSVGYDGHDDGGTSAPNAGEAFASRRPGTDFVFNEPQP